MKAINKTKNSTIASNVRLAKNPLSRMVGLLLDSNLPDDTGLLIVPGKQIHSWFMRFTFDAVFINKEGNVIHLIENMKPWKCSKLLLKAKSVLELPAGTIAKTNIDINDKIEFS
ncbi:MAG: DUF192 domain-containing protein [Cyanobacteriota bacterium]